MNKEEFIGKLQMVYVGDKNASADIISEFHRLNNIINELEKWLIEYRTFIDYPDYYEKGIIDCLDAVLEKLKELKEGNK